MTWSTAAMRRDVELAGGAALLLLWLSGCDSKAKDCNAVIDGINVAVERIKQNQVTRGETEQMVAEFKTFAKTVKEEADRIDALAIENVELKALRAEYVSMANETVSAANSLVGAMDELRASTTRAEQLQKDLQQSMSDLEKACVGSVCLEVMQRIAKTDSGDDDKLVADLTSLADDLGAMKTNNPAVDAAVAKHAAHTKELATVLGAMKSAENKGDEAQKQLDQATEREDPLVDKINAFCGAT